MTFSAPTVKDGQVSTALTPSSISTTRPLQRGKVSLDRGMEAPARVRTCLSKAAHHWAGIQPQRVSKCPESHPALFPGHHSQSLG